MHPQVKAVGSNGQISLGKAFAGKTVLIDQLDASTWVIKSGEFVPDSERWLHFGDGSDRLEKALAWAESHAPKDNFDAFVKKNQ